MGEKKYTVKNLMYIVIGLFFLLLLITRDQTLSAHITTVVVGITGCSIYTWWWSKYNYRATRVYKYITYLIYGLTIYGIIVCFTRIYGTFTGDTSFLKAWWWPIKNYIILYPFACIVCYMLENFLSGEEFNNDKRD